MSCKASEMDTKLLLSFGIVVRWFLHHEHHLQSTEVATVLHFSASDSISQTSRTPRTPGVRLVCVLMWVLGFYRFS